MTVSGEALDATLNGWDAFQAVEIRTATVLEALPFPEARVPAIKLKLDIGDGQVRWSSAQITDHYSASELPGRQVLTLVNVAPRRIAGFSSQCLVLGVPDAGGKVVLVKPDAAVPAGARLY
jgi:tRNA-binding protein